MRVTNAPVRQKLSRSEQGLVDYSAERSAWDVLSSLLRSGLISAGNWNLLSTEAQQELRQESDSAALLVRLVEYQMITKYQADRIRSGRSFGLLLGNYRVLERIGVGGMGVVYKAEHLRLPRLAAIKVLSCGMENEDNLLDRFFFEMESIARLNHPNIVSAIDAGVACSPSADVNSLYYFVMEFVPGQNLEELVRDNGPMDLLKAADVIYQVAAAMSEAHRQDLVHRDLKPSNVLVTPEGQAKLLDFGLARHFNSRLTEPGTVLGTLDYLPPEQAEDATSVDERADIFSLGGTFFWCLTGHPPFPSRGNIVLDMAARMTEAAYSVHKYRPEVPVPLADLIARMLATQPKDRPTSVEEVRRSLLPFLKPETYQARSFDLETVSGSHAETSEETSGRVKRVLIVDDDVNIRRMCIIALRSQGFAITEAEDGQKGEDLLRAQPFDLALLDIDMPKLSGLELLARIKEDPPSPHLKVILFSGRVSADEMAKCLSAGADDYLTKPVSLVQLTSRINSALRLKEAQDRSDQLHHHLLSVNYQLEQNLGHRDSDLVQARNAMVIALAELVAHRDPQSGQHLFRMQRYCRVLAEEASQSPVFSDQIDSHFIQMLECVAPLHDIGKVGLPDHVLLKPGRLDNDERGLMQTHTTIGADTLAKVAQRHGFSVTFFQMAMDVARHHHERWDGKGYPDGLAGEDIPLAARIVSVADAYDALRSRRTYKPALSHVPVIQMMTKSAEGQFDPKLLVALKKSASKFERIYSENPG